MIQKDAILEYLQAGNSITPLEALAKFQCFRLSGRILELRAAGHEIITETHVTLNGKRIARYRLIQPMFQEKAS